MATAAAPGLALYSGSARAGNGLQRRVSTSSVFIRLNRISSARIFVPSSAGIWVVGRDVQLGAETVLCRLKKHFQHRRIALKSAVGPCDAVPLAAARVRSGARAASGDVGNAKTENANTGATKPVRSQASNQQAVVRRAVGQICSRGSVYARRALGGCGGVSAERRALRCARESECARTAVLLPLPLLGEGLGFSV